MVNGSQQSGPEQGGPAPETLSPLSFRELYESFAQDVFRYALCLSGNRSTAEDITSETFLRVWSAAKPMHLATVKAYLFAIARNLYLQLLRRKKLQKSRPLEKSRHMDAREQAAAGDLVRSVAAKEELKIVLTALQELPESSRTALLLRAEHGLPYEEIAALLEISVGAAKVKVHRARSWLEQKTQRSAVSGGPSHPQDIYSKDDQPELKPKLQKDRKALS